jgi:hypothetical protein
MAAQSTPVAVAGVTTLAVSAVPGVTLRGFWLVTSAAATVTIYDNASAASGTILAQWTTTGAGQDKSGDFADGVRCANGIYVSASAGTVTGNVRIG